MCIVCFVFLFFFFSSRRRHTRCALVTGVQTCALPIYDAVAFIRSLAELRGRNADWAEAAVREAASLSARAALEAGVVEIVAGDVEDLLAQIDGRKIGRASCRERVCQYV